MSSKRSIFAMTAPGAFDWLFGFRLYDLRLYDFRLRLELGDLLVQPLHRTAERRGGALELLNRLRRTTRRGRDLRHRVVDLLRPGRLIAHPLVDQLEPTAQALNLV